MGNILNPLTTDEARYGNDAHTITTLEIAEMMNTDHWQILRKLEGYEKNGKHVKGYVEILNDNKIVVVDYFLKSNYIDAKGEERPCYNVTKLGCDFLSNKFTGEKGVIFTAKYVKRFHDMGEYITTEKVDEKPRLGDINKAAEILESVYRTAGADSRYIAILIGGVYKESGMNIQLPPIEMDTAKLYDQTMIADELGIMSSSGKPHSQAVGVIIGNLDISDDDKIMTPYNNHGHSGVNTQYKDCVVDMVRHWIESNSYPAVIQSGNKKYKVAYR